MSAFANGETAEANLKKSNPPDVVIVDVRLLGRSGIDLIRDGAPRLADTSFLVLSTSDNDDLVFSALEAGASGYLLKRSLPSEVADAIRELHEGGAPMSTSIARKVVAAFRRNPRGLAELSPRENQLLECRGERNGVRGKKWGQGKEMGSKKWGQIYLFDNSRES